MADPIDDGGPAFPPHFPTINADGVTKREWFAGMTLKGIGTWCPERSVVESRVQARADYCYRQADAMIKAGK